MQNPNFKNGQNIDVQTAFASFVIMMGLLFHIDAAPGVHTTITLSTILIGVVWFIGRQYYSHYHHA